MFKSLWQCGVFSVNNITMLGRQHRLPVNRLSVKDEVLAISGSHVINSNVTRSWVVRRSRRTCRTFYVTVEEVSSAISSGVIV